MQHVNTANIIQQCLEDIQTNRLLIFSKFVPDLTSTIRFWLQLESSNSFVGLEIFSMCGCLSRVRMVRFVQFSHRAHKSELLKYFSLKTFPSLGSVTE